MFWAHLTSHTHKQRIAEFTYIPPGLSLPTFGLGVLGPNDVGTCEADEPEPTWSPEWKAPGDGMATTAWRELCRLNRTRLCSIGAAAMESVKKGSMAGRI
jgi:hypothetical protein